MTQSKVVTELTLALAATPAFAVPELAKDVVNFFIPTAQASIIPEPGLVPLPAVGAIVGIEQIT